jgi:polysaccharide biosynthesis/export protein
MLKKSILFFLLLLQCTFVYAEDVIEIGDVLFFHAVDEKRTDLILGTVTQIPNYQAIDPHEIQVSNRGQVYLLHAGSFHVAGKTPSEVEIGIKNKLSKHYKGVIVSVLQKTIRMNKIYVLGEVLNPGLYEIPRYDLTKNRLMNAINKAGGFSERANQGKIVIMRKGAVAFEANIYKLIEDNSLSENFALKDGDSIIVKKSFSKVYVLGEVNTPGGVPFIPNTNPIEYISEAGGFNDKADMNNIGIVRRKDDKIYVQKIKANLIDATISPVNVVIKEGDVIFIAKHFFADWKDIGTFFGLARDSVYIFETISK